MSDLISTCENKKEILRYLDKANIKEFWVKVGHSTFYKVTVKDHNLVLRQTKINYDSGLEGSDRSYTRNWSLEPITNGYEYLANHCQNNDGGAFFGCSDGHSPYPLKAEQKYSTQIITEIDDLPQNEQLKLYQWFSQVSGLIPYLISSGGKSIHGHLLSEPLPIEKIVYLRRLFCLIVDGDPAVTRPHQPFRLPTFYRKEKGNYQEILQVGDSYSYDEILDGFRKCFEALGYVFPESINNDWWSHLTSILNSDKNSKARKKEAVSKQEKINNLKTALQQGQDYFYQQRKKTQKARIEKAKQYQEYNHQLTNSDQEKIILSVLEVYPESIPGKGTYLDDRALAVSIANVLGKDAAIALMSKHSPQRNWDQIINSSHGDFSLGTIIFYGKQHGWKPPQKDFIDPVHGRVICSGEEAIARAREAVLNLTEDEINEYFLERPREFNKEQFIQWIQKKRKAEYKARNKKIKPNIRENSRYCNYSTLRGALPSDFSGIIGIKSAKGTAKSGMIGKYYYDEAVQRLLPDGDSLINDLGILGYEIISGVPRVALGDEQAPRWNLEFINNAKDKYKCAIESRAIALCFDSLHYLTNRVYEGSKICLILDEINSNLEHLLTSSTLKENRNKIIREFERLIIAIYENGGLIVLSDADLKQSHFDYFQSIINKKCNGKFDTFTYKNDFKYQDRPVYNFESKATLTNLIYELVKVNQRLIIPVDSITECKAICESLEKRFPNKKIIPINSHSISDKDKGSYYRKYVTNPNQTLQEERPDVLIYTNSMGMGVSLDDNGLDYNYFDYVVCFANGTLAPDQVRQQIWRYRRQCPILLYVDKRSHRHSYEIPFNPNDCEKNIIKLTSQSLSMSDYFKDILKEAKNDFDYLNKLKDLLDEFGCRNVHLKYLSNILANRNYEFEHYREILIDELIEIENNKVTTIDQEIVPIVNNDGSINYFPSDEDDKNIVATATLLALKDEFNRLQTIYLFSLLEDVNFNTEVKEQKKVIKIRHAVKLSKSIDIDIERAKELASCQSLSETERLMVEKAFLAVTYESLTNNPEFCYLATRDKKRSLNAMRLGYLLQHPEIAKFYENKAWDNFHHSSVYGIGLLTDVKKLTPKIKLLRNLRINELLAPCYESQDYYRDFDKFTLPQQYLELDEDQVKQLRKRWLRYKRQIKQIFGYTFTAKTDPLKFLNFLLKKLNFQLDTRNGLAIVMKSLKGFINDGNAISYFWHSVNKKIQIKYDIDYLEKQKHNYHAKTTHESVVNYPECDKNRDKNLKFMNFDFLSQTEKKIPQPCDFENEKINSPSLINKIKNLDEPNNTTTRENELDNLDENMVSFAVGDDIDLTPPEGFFDDWDINDEDEAIAQKNEVIVSNHNDDDDEKLAYFGECADQIVSDDGKKIDFDKCSKIIDDWGDTIINEFFKFMNDLLANNQDTVNPIDDEPVTAVAEPEPPKQKLTDLIDIGQKFIIKNCSKVFEVLGIENHQLGLMVDCKAPNDIMTSRFSLSNLIHSLKMEIIS